MTGLDAKILAFADLCAASSLSKSELREAEGELRGEIVHAVLTVLPALCGPLRVPGGFANGAKPRGVAVGACPAGPMFLLEDGSFTPACPPPGELARELADLLDRQLAGSLPDRVLQLRAQACLMRALAGALVGMRSASSPKAHGRGRP